jgi:hypothetical protein
MSDCIMSFHERPWFASTSKSPATTVSLAHDDDLPVFFLEANPHDIQHLDATPSILLDTGYSITTVDSSAFLMDYITPSKSPCHMRSTTQQIVSSVGEGLILFPMNGNTCTMQVPCQHTPDTPSIIFLPADTCEHLNYYAYAITCNHRTHLATVTFTRPVKPSITLDGEFCNHLPLISLHSQEVLLVTHANTPTDLLTVGNHDTSDTAATDMDTAVHSIRQLLHTTTPLVSLSISPADYHRHFLLSFHDLLTDSMLHGGPAVLPVLHVSAAVNLTMWHIRTCRPYPDRLI